MGKVVKKLFDAEGDCDENGLACYSRVGGSRHWQCHPERRTVGLKSKDLVIFCENCYFGGAKNL